VPLTIPERFGSVIARVVRPTGSGEYVRRSVVSRALNSLCPDGGRVVDLGAGAGNLWVALRPDLRGRYVVIDVQSNGFGHRIIGDVTAGPLASGCADAVCLSDVLEHLVNDVDAVREAVRIARPGAHVVLHVPSTRVKPYAFMQRAADGAEAVDHQQFPHVRDGYTHETLSAMLSEVSGVEVVALSPSFAAEQSLISDVDAYLWWHNLTPLRVLPWCGIRLASLRSAQALPAASSSGFIAVLQKQ